jgi:hypothetical protein
MKDMNTLTNKDKIVNVMRSSRGRYFGLTTVQGNQVNARFINETPHYVRVYDRNTDRKLTIAKTSLAGIRYDKTAIA